jgi:hypothetical protein
MARSALERIAKKYEVNFTGEVCQGILRIANREPWCLRGVRVFKGVIPSCS